MHIQARRIFRLSFVPALALAIAYAISTPLPFIAPLFAFFLTAMPGPPLGAKKLLGLVLLVIITLGIGILLIPLLLNFQLTALLLVLIGLYLSSYLTVNLSKNLPGTFLAVGVTMISAAGTVNDSLATTIIQALVLGIIIAVICQSLIYPFFPEDPPDPFPDKSQLTEQQAASSKIKGAVQSNWIAIRSTLIVFPAYLLLLTNPMMYLPIAIKAVSLSQQVSTIDVKSAGRELIDSTLLGGLFAILFWFALGIWTNLWMFFLWMLLFSLFFSCKIYQLIATRFPASFWLNTAVTMLILLGPAVEDSASGKDVYAAFFSRAMLFILITLYAVFAVYFLEHLNSRYGKNTYVS
ncbi:MAG: DUF2955 domain-containing protein [gamma proteobacterium symbiont of Lucinoma myriamae]|nr:DUF2955 domain-containing protein [gamma proteobacterium symbiont of Lucinoma myriamae]MCU7819313.1 DUF2955 domain-containing protein [gamma proteobacterium symbiont of Lucinoma myriamae]MCU7831726.1 DUF2955 domain-containing protein [gamma proteobacterium symbiont of Lucinoma myriamae]